MALGREQPPCQLEGVFRSCDLQHHVRAAMIAVRPDKGFAVLRLTNQHVRIVRLNKGAARRILFADDDPLRCFEHHAEQGADAGQSRADDEDGVLLRNLRNARRPEAGCQNVADKQRLFIRNLVRNFVQFLIGVGDADKFCLSVMFSFVKLTTLLSSARFS